MDWIRWIEIIASIISGVAVAIPIVLKLVDCVERLVAEKQWGVLIKKVLELMVIAEREFEDGKARKEQVMEWTENVALSIGYEYDDAAKTKVSDFIDAVCDASRIINKEEQEDE